ncbi:MAG: membrane protein insertion efficiency factor YidD [Methyloligellaceae bacterium]
MEIAGKVARMVLKAPILLYRYTLSSLVGWRCRHLPTCSEYALEAIDRNGAWKGGWLTLARILRCHPWGSSGHDPVPDLSAERHPWWAPWRYGRWKLKGDALTASGPSGHKP